MQIFRVIPFTKIQTRKRFKRTFIMTSCARLCVCVCMCVHVGERTCVCVCVCAFMLYVLNFDNMYL